LTVSIIDAIRDPNLLGASFRDLSTWQAWLVVLRTLFGLPMDDAADLALFNQCTGLTAPPAEGTRESAIVAGRRSGKSFISAVVAVYLACFRDWTSCLSPGERGMIFIIATDRNQAGIIRRYIGGILSASPVLSRMIERETQDEIHLRNRTTIGIKTASFRTIRGYTVLCAILEETAFWRSEESANPDREVLQALRPALSTTGGYLILISTPYSRRGILWELHKKNYGQPGRTLVWQAPSVTMNPTLDPAVIEAALADDPQAARSEWLAEWRSDIETFLGLEQIEPCVVPDRGDLPRVKDVAYSAFLDPSGGRRDSFTCAVCHVEKSGKVIVDVLRERRPPFKPSEVVAEYAALLKSYGVMSATSDRYGGEWVGEAFRKHGIEVPPSELSTSELYVELVPLILNGAVELPDDKRLLTQLTSLERRTRAGGKDVISHYPGSHDDLANAVAGACVLASRAAVDSGPLIVQTKRTIIRYGERYGADVRPIGGGDFERGFIEWQRTVKKI